jgi:hypothetical protein
VRRHTLEAAIDFIAATVNCCCAPADKMVFEDALVELVVDIGGETLKDVNVG